MFASTIFVAIRKSNVSNTMCGRNAQTFGFCNQERTTFEYCTDAHSRHNYSNSFKLQVASTKACLGLHSGKTVSSWCLFISCNGEIVKFKHSFRLLKYPPWGYSTILLYSFRRGTFRPQDPNPKRHIMSTYGVQVPHPNTGVCIPTLE